MDTKEISGFLDTQGRLTALPAKKKKKLLALAWLAEHIPPEQEYTEKEFNDLLYTLHTFGDPATLRRELYDFYLIHRETDGRHYRLNPERPSPQELIEKYC